MRTLVIIPIAIVVVGAIGVLICRSLGFDPHVREMLLAGGACFIASELAMIPMVLTRGASQPAVAQAGLAGTVIHMFACAALGGGLLLVKSLQLGSSMAYWLLGFYWLTLIIVATGLSQAVKAAPVDVVGVKK